MKVDEALLFRFFSKKNDAKQSDAIARWLDEDETHVKAFQDAYRQFALSTLTLNQQPSPVRIRPIRRRIGWAFATAAAATAIVLGIFAYGYRRDLSEMEKMTLLSQANYGSRLSQTLSDGSVVELNSGSKLSYPAVFHGGERRVALEGEAVFNVSHDADMPFIVETFAYDVTVTGTRFDVIADKEEGSFCATLLEGSVLITDKQRNVLADLKPRQKVSMDEGGSLKIETLDNAADEILWTQDLVSLAGMSFGDIMHKLEKSFGVSIVTDTTDLPTETLPYCKVRISDGVVAAFEVLAHHYNFTYEFNSQDNSYHIR